MNKRQIKQVFFVIAALILFSSCRDKSSLLVNTWMVSDLKYTREIPESMRPVIENSVNEMKKSFRLIYRADGTYTTTVNGQVMNGKWKLNASSTVITATSEKGSSTDFKIVELVEKKFSFEAEEGGDKVIFVMIPGK